MSIVEKLRLKSKTTDSRFDQAYKAESIRLLYEHPITGVIIPFLIFTIFISLWLETQGETALVLWPWWIAVAWGLTVDAIMFYNYYKQADKTLLKEKKWVIYHAMAACHMGFCFNSVYFFIDLNFNGNALFAFSIHVINIVGVTINTSLSRQVYKAYLVPALLLPIIPFFRHELFLEYCLVSVGIMTMATVYSGKISRLLHRSIELQIDKDELVEMLTSQKAIAEIASASKTKFLAAASHDLRQPLQSLSLLIAALFAHMNTDKQRAILNKAKLSLASLNELLDSLLDISKLDAGLIRPQAMVINLKALLEGEIEKVAQEASTKNLEVSFSYECPDMISSDPILISRILSNLISNACRYTQKGSIHITAFQQEDESTVIEIRDTGIGISSDTIDLIFNEFYQVENNERDRTKGLGLGLSIVKRLSALIDANISVESELDKGSTFSLALPTIELTEIVKSSELRIPPSDYDVSGLNLLVIDDEILIRESMELLLESWDNQVSTHASQKDALKHLSNCSEQPDALIVDYRLSEQENGIECIQEIRRMLNKELPSLIITGDTAPEQVKELEFSGIPFIHKPINAEALRDFLKSIKN